MATTEAGFDVEAIWVKLVSHAQASGVFGSVIRGEPKSAPGKGVSAAVMFDGMNCAQTSGLSTTTVVVQFILRIYTSMIGDPQTSIDPDVMKATGAMFTRYIGDFTLDGLVRKVDVFGAWSPGLRTRPGYMNQDGRLYRVNDIGVPLLVDDAYDQEA